MSQEIFVLGSNGMLGQAMTSELSSRGLSHKALNRNDLDFYSLGAFPYQIKPGDKLINCAAYTDVAGAELNPELALQANAFGPSEVARECKLREVKFFHVSTDYVFDGLKSTPYLVNDKTNPIQEYGRSKALGEQLCLEHEATIVRTSWLYGAGQNNFYSKILHKLAHQKIVEVVDDQYGVPTSTEYFATQLLDNIAAFQNEPIVHIVPRGSTSWFGFSERIKELHGSENLARIVRTRTIEDAIPHRPRYSVMLPHEDLENRDWQQVLCEYWEKNPIQIAN